MEPVNKLTVIICRGLPASGKTTYARDWVLGDPQNRVLIEKDEIRKNPALFVDGVYNYKRGDEGAVIQGRDKLIHRALLAGKSVVSSDTNLVQKHTVQISNIAKKYGAEVKIVDFFDVPLKELIERDKKRDDTVGEHVIRRMFHQQVKTMPTFLKLDQNLEYCVISDVDGSLTNGPKNRSPYEWNKVGNDDINLGVAAILDGIKTLGLYKVFLFSGRNEVCRPETEAWLEKHDIEYDALYMRPESRNNDKDTVIKSDLIEEHIRGKYNVLFWIDDRPQIVEMLHDVYGINVLARGDQRYQF